MAKTRTLHRHGQGPGAPQWCCALTGTKPLDQACFTTVFIPKPTSSTRISRIAGFCLSASLAETTLPSWAIQQTCLSSSPVVPAQQAFSPTSTILPDSDLVFTRPSFSPHFYPRPRTITSTTLPRTSSQPSPPPFSLHKKIIILYHRIVGQPIGTLQLRSTPFCFAPTKLRGTEDQWTERKRRNEGAGGREDRFVWQMQDMSKRSGKW